MSKLKLTPFNDESCADEKQQDFAFGNETHLGQISQRTVMSIINIFTLYTF